MLDKEIFKDRILVLDGAMGTMIQRYGLQEKDFHEAGTSDAAWRTGRDNTEDATGNTRSAWSVQEALQKLKENTRELKGNNECLNLTHPEIIEEIHREYIAAGADIIECNTFSANRISQKEYGTEALAYTMAREGAATARRAADKALASEGRHILVAASIGPTSKSLSLAPDINHPDERPYSFRDMAEAYSEQLRGVIDGGADVILIETCFDALNTKAAIYALEKLTEKAKAGADDTTSANILSKLDSNGAFPAIVSVSVNDRSGRTLTGQTVQAFWTSVSHYPLLAFGLNCSLGADDLMPIIKDVADFVHCPVICYPNAGLPNEMGGYDESPEDMAKAVRKMAEAHLINIIGGCCGTTPAHIAAIAKAVEELSPRQVNADATPHLTVSGLESVSIDLKNSNFTNIGERTNVAGSRKFAKLIAAGDYEAGLQIAAQQIENGAGIIDINMDDAMLDSRACMERFVRYIANDPAVAKAALMIDSSHWDSILAGLENAQGKCIVNSISLKEGEETFLRKAAEIHDLGAAMVVMAFDEQGQATTYSRKIEICSRAYSLLTQRLHIPPQDIIFDVNVLSVGTGIEEHARYGIDFIEAVKWIKQNLPGAYTSGGISNLSFAFRGNNTVREAMHSIFLYHAVKAGLDMGIVNPGMLQVYDDIEPDLLRKAEDVILDKDPEATERLIAKAQEIMAAKEAAKADGKPAAAVDEVSADPEERLKECLVKGRNVGLEADVMECYHRYGAAVKVIEGPLMAGMEKVGEMCGAGKMFLPQVVKSAKIMKEAVSILEPYMTGDGDGDKERPVIVNATVKGDVHDIGKNITGIVLGCNGFNVIDLGVMVDKERILDEAVRHHAAIIGASGLITPSLYQMEELCREMTRRGMDIPLFIGGATTSALHTAVKLAPLYAHVFYGQDASAAAVMAKRCMMDRAKFEADEHAAQDRIRALYESKAQVNADVSRPVQANAFSNDSYLRADEQSLTDIPTKELPISEVMPYFDWRMFLAIWGMKYGEELPDDPAVEKTLADGKTVLERFRTRHEVTIQISERILYAIREGQDIKVKDGEATFPMLRQETPDSKGRCLSLADFVPSESYGPMGIFAVSIQTSHGPECTCGCHPKGYMHPQVPGGNIVRPSEGTKDYDSMMDRAVRVTLAEAASLWLDDKLKSELHPAGGRTVNVVKPAAGYASCPDHTLKKDIIALLPDASRLGISFTESYAMIPDASICGFIFLHPEASYPEIRHISERQYNDYRIRRGMSEEQAEQFLGHLR